MHGLIKREKLSNFTDIVLQQKQHKSIYYLPLLYMKALKLEMAKAVDLDTLQNIANGDAAGLYHFLDFPQDTCLPSDETALKRSENKTRLSEAIILAIAALMNCQLLSRASEQDGLIFHNISPVKGCDHIVSSIGKDPFYYHTEVAYSQKVPKFLMLYCLESDLEDGAKTSYFPIQTILNCIPEDMKETMRKPIFRISAVPGYESNAIVAPLLEREGAQLEFFRFYQHIDRIEAAPRSEKEAVEVNNCLHFLKNQAPNIFPPSGEEPAIGLQKGEALLINNGWRQIDGEHNGYMHGRVGTIKNPNRWLQRGYFFSTTSQVEQNINLGYRLFLKMALKKFPLLLAANCLKTAIESTPAYRRLSSEHPTYPKSKLLFYSIKPDTNKTGSWLSHLADSATLSSSHTTQEQTMMFDKINTLLLKNAARFRVVRHIAAGKSEEIAAIRGNDIARSAKAMLLKIKNKNKSEQHVLAVLPGNCQLDNKALLKQLNAKSVSMEKNVELVTGCVSGSVPPFSFNELIPLFVDQRIAHLEGGEIAFNAGELTCSIFLDLQDYLRVTQPTIASFSKLNVAKADEVQVDTPPSPTAMR
jgi:Ala-tRNA(Pro) deacylase